MRRLVTIDLAGADLAMFEAYEAKVLPLLEKYGARLEMRVRSVDGQCETHLLFFPDAQSVEGYRSDPNRVAVLTEWERSGAKSSIVEVERVGF
ncbi:MAG: hypothetical protein JWO72_1927 [Caulobacteraceae bacterium]|nr:hypothetical protein [Caulobacteraceae bacterium]